MTDTASGPAPRDRIGHRLAELARMLDGDPSPATVAMVRAELERLANRRG